MSDNSLELYSKIIYSQKIENKKNINSSKNAFFKYNFNFTYMYVCMCMYVYIYIYIYIYIYKINPLSIPVFPVINIVMNLEKLYNSVVAIDIINNDKKIVPTNQLLSMIWHNK